MRIGFDAKRAAQNCTGLGNYSRLILRLLSSYNSGDEYFYYTPKEPGNMLSETEYKGKICTPESRFWKKCRSLWRIWGVTDDIIRDGVTLFHGLSNELPLNIKKAGNTKTIVTVHDLIFLIFPHYYPYIDRHIYAYKFRKACRNADRIIAVSECTKRDIVRFFHICENKIDVVYQGCGSEFKQQATDFEKKQLIAKYHLPESFILYVGSIEERKNLLLVVRALTLMKNPIPLIAIGKRTAYTEKVEDYVKAQGLTHLVKLLHNVPTQELPAFYQLSATFVYPSFYEGFGIPVLEALQSGVPVVAATGSCLEEAGGPCSLYVNPNDPEALAIAIEQTLTDETLRQQMIMEGKKYASKFDDEFITRDLLNIYRKTI